MKQDPASSVAISAVAANDFVLHGLQGFHRFPSIALPPFLQRQIFLDILLKIGDILHRKDFPR
jgi:hypothetical protein